MAKAKTYKLNLRDVPEDVFKSVIKLQGEENLKRVGYVNQTMAVCKLIRAGIEILYPPTPTQ